MTLAESTTLSRTLLSASARARGARALPPPLLSFHPPTRTQAAHGHIESAEAGAESEEAALIVDPGRWTQLGYDDVWDFQPMAQANACTTLAAMIHRSVMKKGGYTLDEFEKSLRSLGLPARALATGEVAGASGGRSGGVTGVEDVELVEEAEEAPTGEDDESERVLRLTLSGGRQLHVCADESKATAKHTHIRIRDQQAGRPSGKDKYLIEAARIRPALSNARLKISKFARPRKKSHDTPRQRRCTRATVHPANVG